MVKKRYASKDEVQIGHQIIFDNTSGYIKNFPQIKMVGAVTDLGTEDRILVEFKIYGYDPFMIPIPYFLAQ